jgi:hypothetical protein
MRLSHNGGMVSDGIPGLFPALLRSSSCRSLKRPSTSGRGEPIFHSWDPVERSPYQGWSSFQAQAVEMLRRRGH